MKSRTLTINVFIALLFCVANLFSYFLMPESSTIDDGFVVFGWPFSVYAYGGFFTHTVIIWTGLIGNVFVALCAGRILKRIVDAGWFRRRLLSSSPSSVNLSRLQHERLTDSSSISHLNGDHVQ
jgi:hypothetical protein